MDRREALKALVSLPATARISVASLKPDDVIVIECDEHLSHEAMENLADRMKQVWPRQKVAVLPKGLKLKVVAGV